MLTASRLPLHLLAVIASFLVFAPAQPALAAVSPRQVTVVVDTLPVSFDVAPVIVDGRTLVPFRAIAETLGARVGWNEASQTVTANDGRNQVVLQVGNRLATVNGQPRELDVPPQIIGGRTLIPLRFFSQALEAGIRWDDPTSTAFITSPRRPLAVTGFYALGSAEASSWTDLFGTPYPGRTPGNTDVVSEIAAGWYTIDGQGNLRTADSRSGYRRPDGWEEVLAAASTFNVAAEMMVHATNGDGTLTALLSNTQAAARAVQAIAAEAGPFRGVNVDFEGLGLSEKGADLAAVRDRFTSFVADLAAALHDSGKTLTVTLHAPNSVYQGYDYVAVGHAADRIIVMAYDYGTTGKPEPVDKVKEAVVQAIALVPAERLILGISAVNENPTSLVAKIGLAKRYGLVGIALWRLGVVGGERFDVIRSMISRPE